MRTMLGDVGVGTTEVRQFLRHLSASRLLAPVEVEELERRAQFEPLDDLQAELIRDGRLTQYQLYRITNGQSEGLVMGKYRILRALGDGGFGNVYLAYHSLMHRQVALKVLGDHISNDSVCKALFRREVVATTRLSHPNIATALDADDCDGQVFLVMEYVEGPTLEAYTTARHGVSAALARTILLQAAAALQYASQLGFVHRDVKPANMILSGVLPQSPDDPGSMVCVKLLDFGLARVPTPAPNANILGTLPCVEGGMIGTPAFMPPEQIVNPHSADVRSDMYSLGCSLFYALTHRLPFQGASASEVVRKQLTEPPPAIFLRRPDIPTSLADVILRLMAKDPADRFQTPRELTAALNNPAVLSESALLALPLAVPSTFGEDPRLISPTVRDVRTPDVPPPTQAEIICPVLEDPEPPTPIPLEVATPVSTNELLTLWAEWMNVVTEVGDTGDTEWLEDEYRLLYSRLLANVTAVEQSRPESERGKWQRMAAAVEPWVNVRSLCGLDTRMLASLRKTCKAINAEVNPPKSRQNRLGWWLFLAAVLLASLAASGLGILQV